MSDAAAAPAVPTAPVSAGATATAPITAPASTATAPSAPDWTSGFNDELKGYIQNKGFKDPAMVLESYRNFEKLQGVPQERLLKLPESIDLSTSEGRAIFERLGAPKDAKDYSIDIPKEAGDPKLAEWFRDVAYKNGMTQKQVEGLVKSWNESTMGQRKAMLDSQIMKQNEQHENLKKEWGQAHDQNINIAKAATIALGIGKEQIDAIESALGFDGTMKLLHKLGVSTGEHAYVQGNSVGGAMTPEQAQSQIKALTSDPGFRSRLVDGDADARKQWDMLHKFAYTGNTSL